MTEELPERVVLTDIQETVVDEMVGVQLVMKTLVVGKVEVCSAEYGAVWNYVYRQLNFFAVFWFKNKAV